MRYFDIKRGLILGLLGFLFVFAGQSSAQTGSSDRQVKDNLRRLQGQMSTFGDDMQNAMSRTRMKPSQSEDINKSLDDLGDAIDNFSNDLRDRRDSSEGVNNILQQAQAVDGFLAGANLGGAVSSDWSKMRATLDQLAGYYRISWDWGAGRGNGDSRGDGRGENRGDNRGNDRGDNRGDSGGYPDQTPSSPVSQQDRNLGPGLSGTYRLDASASDNAHDVAERAGLIVNQADRGRVKAELEDKLTPPDTLTLDIRGQQVTVTSSKGGQFNFVADGTDKYETGPDGKNVRVRATLKGDRLSITRTSEGDDDFTVIFESIDNGSHLRVTRRVNYTSLSQTVLAESLYNKTSDLAQGGRNDDPGTYSDSNPGNNPGSDPGNNRGGNNDPNRYPPNQYPTTTTGRLGAFVVPNGTLIVARLENEITTKASQNNDRFTLTVQSPDEFRGAVIDGFISGVKRSGKVNGRAQITFNFEHIRLPNGQSYDFAGYMQSLTDTNGETVQIDTEGVAKGDNQGKETAKRGGVGAAIGAVIGGVIGGVHGAIVGATIGAGAGAGSVYVQGKDDLELKPGSRIRIQSTSPRDPR